MKISSRPGEEPAGEGAYTLRMDLEELQLISAYLYNTRLGLNAYQMAAFKLMHTIESLFGDDFTEDAASSVDLYVSKLGVDGDTIIEQYHNTEVAFEV